LEIFDIVAYQTSKENLLAIGVLGVLSMHVSNLIIMTLSQPHFGLSVRVNPTLPKVGTWSPPGLPKI
jgi:hypothetical protein